MRHISLGKTVAAAVLAATIALIGGTGDALAAGASPIQPAVATTISSVQTGVLGGGHLKVPHPKLVASRVVRAP